MYDAPLANIGTYFIQSNFAGQVIIFILLVCSMVAWTLMIGKNSDIRRMRKQNISFERKLGQQSSALRVDPDILKNSPGPYARLAKEAYQAYYRVDSRLAPSPAARMQYVENALQRGVNQATIQYESKMVMLGSIVTLAPFLGLLGTVWGVMDAFGGLALTNSASIQMLAPGVSGALLTTVAGLMVAIPSVFGYNYLLTQTKIMTTEVENFASSLADRLELEAHAEEGA